MRIDLPCEIVKDLLPNYVDGLASDSSTESVEQHLKQCSECQTLYETMRKEYQEPSRRSVESTEETVREKTLFRKINRKLNKKVRRVAGAGITGVFLVAVLFYGLFNVAVKDVPVEEVTVSAHVYDMEHLKDISPEEMITGDYPSEEMSVVISKGEKVEPDGLITITIPENSEISYTVTDAVLEDCPYVTVIEYSSPYYLRAIDWDYQTVGEERILYISGFRTTLLNHKAEAWNNSTATLEFNKVDRIIYVDDNQRETVLWEG